MLEADPDTDWSKVNLTTLHEHLVDMDEVTLRAAVKEQPTDHGLRIEISGTGRTCARVDCRRASAPRAPVGGRAVPGAALAWECRSRAARSSASPWNWRRNDRTARGIAAEDPAHELRPDDCPSWADPG